jgi:hypothetical protein
MESLCRLFEQGDPNGRFASLVMIALKDGRIFNSGLVDGGLRFPPSEWNEERMTHKFRWLAEYVLEAQSVDELQNLLLDFNALPSVRQLTRELSGNRRKEVQ